MDDAAALLEIEAIKQLKARYCRYLDTKDWEAWRGIFADDFLSDTSEAGGKVIRRRRRVRRLHAQEPGEAADRAPGARTGDRADVGDDCTRHLGSQRRRSIGAWAEPRGYGHYHETYEKIDGQWRITSSKLTRLRKDIFNPLFSVHISDRLSRVAGKLAR